MGIGLAVVFSTALLGAVALPFVLALLGFARLTGGPTRHERVGNWLGVVVLVTICYSGPAFIVYAVWCGVFRGVDLGIGDWWGVPLEDGFSLTFIDVSDHAAIYARHATEGAALIDDIRQIGHSPGYVFGVVGTTEAFVLTTMTGDIRRCEANDLPAALRELGLGEKARLQSVHSFYMARRWGWQDAAAAFALGMPPLVVGIRTFRRAWHGPADGRLTSA